VGIDAKFTLLHVNLNPVEDLQDRNSVALDGSAAATLNGSAPSDLMRIAEHSSITAQIEFDF
jgi:hypothetical protein